MALQERDPDGNLAIDIQSLKDEVDRLKAIQSLPGDVNVLVANGPPLRKQKTKRKTKP